MVIRDGIRWDISCRDKNRDGAVLRISCASAGDRSIAVELDTPLLKTGTTDLQIVGGGESYNFELTGRGVATLSGFKDH